MPIETFEDIIEGLADKFGVFGAHGSCDVTCTSQEPCRMCWTESLESRLRAAFDIERRLASELSRPVEAQGGAVQQVESFRSSCRAMGFRLLEDDDAVTVPPADGSIGGSLPPIQADTPNEITHAGDPSSERVAYCPKCGCRLN